MNQNNEGPAVWSSTRQATAPRVKLCPFCFEEIKVEAKKCKHCWTLMGDDMKPDTTTYPADYIKPEGQSVTSWLVLGLIAAGLVITNPSADDFNEYAKTEMVAAANIAPEKELAARAMLGMLLPPITKGEDYIFFTVYTIDTDVINMMSDKSYPKKKFIGALGHFVAF